MKTISLSVSEIDYEAFRTAAKDQRRSIAQLIRQAMALYRTGELERRTPLRKLPVLLGHRLQGDLPARAEVYAEIFG